MGGLEKVQIEYINFLIKSGYDVRVIIENDNGKENVLEKHILSKVEYIKNYDYILKIRNSRELRDKNIINKIKYNFNLMKERIYTNNKFIKIYEKFTPDIVIDFDASLTKIIDKLKKSKNLVWLHSSIINWKRKKSKINRFVYKIEKYDKIVCICQEMREELVSIKNGLENKIEVLYNPIDFKKIEELSKKDFKESEKKWSSKKYLLMVARLDTVPKDFKTLFLAFDLAKSKGYRGDLYLIGDGPDKEEVEKLKERSKYNNNIILLGKKENPYNWMRKADKIILSSKYEGFSTVLIEGLCLQKEMISSNCKTGVKEILAHDRGEIFEIGDYKKLSEYILQEVKVRKIKLEDFERERTFEKLEKIIGELIC